MNDPIIVIAAGGHARVLIEILRMHSCVIQGIVDDDPKKHGLSVMGIPVLGNDEVLERYPPADVRLVNGIGAIKPPNKRRAVYCRMIDSGYRFASVIHSSAVIASDVVLLEGVQIMAGVVIQPGCRLGRNTIVNTGATIDHDCIIGDHVHVAPGVTISGNVGIDEGVHVGAGATVIQGVHVGKDSIVGAGALVLRSVMGGITVMGVPAEGVRSER